MLFHIYHQVTKKSTIIHILSHCAAYTAIHTTLSTTCGSKVSWPHIRSPRAAASTPTPQGKSPSAVQESGDRQRAPCSRSTAHRTHPPSDPGRTSSAALCSWQYTGPFVPLYAARAAQEPAPQRPHHLPAPRGALRQPEQQNRCWAGNPHCLPSTPSSSAEFDAQHELPCLHPDWTQECRQRDHPTQCVYRTRS